MPPPVTPVRQAAILVGGLGTRLGSLVADVPKPLLPVAGRPFLAWLLRELSRWGIEEAVLLTGHLSGVVDAALPALAAGLPKPIRITVSREPFRAGTGGALHHAAPHLADRFLLLNGDSFLDAPLAPLLAQPLEGALGRLLLRSVPDTARYGVVTLGGTPAGPGGAAQVREVTAFLPRPDRGGPGLINGGIYLLDRGLLGHLSPQCSLEQDVLPPLAAAGRLQAIEAGGWFIDIGIPQDLDRAQTELPARLHRRALFLDRDGVLNVDHGWVGHRDRFDWVDGAREAVAHATRLGWHVFVVTNQSGVARGLYTEDDVGTLLSWVRDEAMRAGGTIDDARYCPYHPEAAIPRYRRASDWRKPAPGMILDLLRTWSLEPGRCLLVGDQPTDIEAAAAAGVPGHRFGGGNLERFTAPLLESAP